MNYTQLITTVITNQNYFLHPVVSFSGKQYPLLYFSHLLQLIKKNGFGSIQFYHISESIDELKIQLSMSFLGNCSLFWLGDITELDQRRKTELITFLTTYTGPHAVWLFSDQSVGTVCALPDALEKNQFIALADSMLFGIQKNPQFTTKLFAKNKMVNFESACLLLQYQRLLGAKTDYFFDHWLDELIVPEQSLFTLSSHFFGQNTEQFLAAWHAIADEYPAQFWCAYWSEQLFRAYWYCILMRDNQSAEAKKIGFRLPFSFLQKDWKLIKSERLLIAHKKIYEIDYALKNGAAESGIFDPVFLSSLK